MLKLHNYFPCHFANPRIHFAKENPWIPSKDSNI
jgi:hypothetical protein